MLWLPCCIGIIRGRKASGFRTYYGGRENLEAISFLRQLNETVYREYPDIQTFAEESTAWPMVSRPTYIGGLGFGMQMGHGLDARHARVHDAGSLFRKYQPQQAHVPNDVRVSARISSCRCRMMKWSTERDR